MELETVTHFDVLEKGNSEFSLLFCYHVYISKKSSELSETVKIARLE